MHRIRPSFLLPTLFVFGITIFSSVVFAQQQLITNTTPGVRDAVAIATVQKALAAFGGVGAISTIQSLESTGQIQKTGSQTPMSFRWMETVSGSHFEFRRETTANGKTRVFASGQGNPGYGVSGNPGKRLGQQMVIAAVPLEMPAVVLYAEFQDPTYSFTLVASSGTDQLIHVRIANDNDFLMKTITQQDWYFDPQTSLPDRIEYKLPSADNAIDVTPASCVYTNYRSVQGVLYPTSIQAFERDVAVSQITIASTQPNASINASELSISLAGKSAGGSN